jgi:hypothetical protein
MGAGRGLTVRRAGIVAAAAAAAVLASTARPAAASPAMRVGIFDQAHALYGQVATTFSLLGALHAQVVRVNLNWGGPFGVARRRPVVASDPADPAYNWARYDRTVTYAAEHGLQVLFSIYGTPAWANGGQPLNVAPTLGIDLRSFAYAAATRYSGTYKTKAGKTLPAVHDWLAWTEPNNPTYLTPQYRSVAGSWIVESAISYTAICNAIYGGIHGAAVAGERVACGGTAPSGNNDPTSPRPSVSPTTFLRSAHAAGLATFDAWAHDPYPDSPAEAPDAPPPTSGGKLTTITLGNIDELGQVVTELYGWKPLWITAYGYETNPPDAAAGVPLATQAQYLTQAFQLARANPRIQLMLWYLLIDDRRPSGWQSGLVTAHGKKKPSFAAFRRMAVGSG